MQANTIEVRQLEKLRESASASFRLTVPEFQAKVGEFIAVVGSSGCGKSTLLDMLALVLRPSSANTFSIMPAARNGDARTSAYDIAQLWKGSAETELAVIRKEVLGYVLQSGGLFPYLSVVDNCLVPIRLKGLSTDTTYLKQLAAQIGLGVSAANSTHGMSSKSFDEKNFDFSLLYKKPRHLSGGQRQRAAILRALVSRPSIVLADEPTAAVDVLTGESIIKAFRDVARENNVSVVMVTHDRHLARGNVDRAYTFDVSRDDRSGRIESVMKEMSVEDL